MKVLAKVPVYDWKLNSANKIVGNPYLMSYEYTPSKMHKNFLSVLVVKNNFYKENYSLVLIPKSDRITGGWSRNIWPKDTPEFVKLQTHCMELPNKNLITSGD